QVIIVDIVAESEARAELYGDPVGRTGKENGVGAAAAVVTVIARAAGRDDRVVAEPAFDEIVAGREVDMLWASAAGSAVLTVLVLVFGEVTPKLWFRQRPYFRCRLLIYPMYIFHLVMYPFIWTLAGVTHMVNHLFGDHGGGVAARINISREEFRILLSESESAELLDPEARQLLHNALEFHDHVVRDVMAPRDQVQCVAADATLAEAVALSRRCNLSRLPVTREGSDTWIGIFNVYDAIFRADRDHWDEESVIDFVRPLVNISEHASVNLALTQSRSTRSPILVVTDNDNRQRGIVTPMDVTYPLVGKLKT
ncbi:MAG: CNNM domain-containing protein, partial [Lentisphaeria bacterium]|nr:CNNM domain-containing protein [Lentisphaeria bacterium]